MILVDQSGRIIQDVLSVKEEKDSDVDSTEEGKDSDVDSQQDPEHDSDVDSRQEEPPQYAGKGPAPESPPDGSYGDEPPAEKPGAESLRVLRALAGVRTLDDGMVDYGDATFDLAPWLWLLKLRSLAMTRHGIQSRELAAQELSELPRRLPTMLNWKCVQEFHDLMRAHVIAGMALRRKGKGQQWWVEKWPWNTETTEEHKEQGRFRGQHGQGKGKRQWGPSTAPPRRAVLTATKT